MPRMWEHGLHRELGRGNNNSKGGFKTDRKTRTRQGNREVCNKNRRIRIDENIKLILAKPQGPLFDDMSFLKDILSTTIFATVGDIVSKEALKLNLFPKIMIIDGMTMRRWIGKLKVKGYKVYKVCNEPGTVNCEVKEILEKCWRSEGRCLIDVEGEEDLLAILALFTAPENALILYGQPGQGFVVLISNEKVKERIREVSRVDCSRA